MSQDPYDLNQLVDLQTQPPVGWWPPAIGWWFVLSGILVWLLAWAVWRYLRWHHRRYRRLGVDLLSYGQHQDSNPLVEIDQILKRVALQSYPRRQVASLSGERWLTFLTESNSQVDFHQFPMSALGGSVVEPASKLTADQLQQVHQAAVVWVQSHRESWE